MPGADALILFVVDLGLGGRLSLRFRRHLTGQGAEGILGELRRRQGAKHSAETAFEGLRLAREIGAASSTVISSHLIARHISLLTITVHTVGRRTLRDQGAARKR